MAWKLVGELYSTGITAALEWDGGLSGSPRALADVDALIERGTAAVTPTGPFLKADKTDELSAFVLGYNVLRGVDVIGTPPALPDIELPAGAIS